MLGAAKILENMEIGHNVMHGQWDWMNDPEIHSSTWEWDTALPGRAVEALAQLRAPHVHQRARQGQRRGLRHPARSHRDQQWHPANLGQPVYNALLASLFEWGVALHDLDIERDPQGQEGPEGDEAAAQGDLAQGPPPGRQGLRDLPAADRPGTSLSTLTANATANVIRNLWAYMIIFCGHFPDGAEKFTEEELEDETRPEWYLRQLLGSANFKGGRLLHIMSGNLGYQIEHHLFPDLPSNRYAEIAERVQALCEKYDLPYTTGPLYRQYCQTLRTIMRLSLPTTDREPESGEWRGGMHRGDADDLKQHRGTVAPQAAVS